MLIQMTSPAKTYEIDDLSFWQVQPGVAETESYAPF